MQFSKMTGRDEAVIRQAMSLRQHFRSVGISDDEMIRAIKSIPCHYAANRQGYTTDDATTQRRSVSIWQNFPVGQVREDNQNGDFIWENFQSFSGSSGQAGGSIARLSASFTPASVASQTVAAQTVAFAGTLTTDLPISIQKPTNQAGLGLSANLLIGTASSLTLQYVNPTAASITPTAGETYVLTVLRQNGFYGGDSGGWRSFEGGTTPGAIQTQTTEFPVASAAVANALGTIRMLTGAAAHNNVALELLGGQYGLPANAAATVPTAGAFPKLFFEARVRFQQSTVQSAFLGLATPGQTASLNTLFTSADAWNNTAAIGFRINGAASTSAINAGYGTTTGWTTGASGAVPTTLTNWTKLGFVFDATQIYALKFYQDGVVTKQLKLGDLVAANWPSNVALTPTLYLQAQGAGGAAVSMDLDWVACGQLMSGGN